MGMETEDRREEGEVDNGAMISAIAMMVIICIMCLGYVAVASLLTHGARKSKPGYLMPWIILTVIAFVFDIIEIIGYLVKGDFTHGVSSTLGLMFGIYLFICVWSFRKQLKGEIGAI